VQHRLSHAAFGAMRLARMLGSGLLFSAFSALALYVAVQVLDDLLTFAFRVSPLRSFRMVQNNCDLSPAAGRVRSCVGVRF
jgi:hypothetical protein